MKQCITDNANILKEKRKTNLYMKKKQKNV